MNEYRALLCYCAFLLTCVASCEQEQIGSTSHTPWNQKFTSGSRRFFTSEHGKLVIHTQDTIVLPQSSSVEMTGAAVARRTRRSVATMTDLAQSLRHHIGSESPDGEHARFVRSQSSSRLRNGENVVNDDDDTVSVIGDRRVVDESAVSAVVAAVPAPYPTSLTDLGSDNAEQEHMLRPEKCIPIEIPLCKNIGYNLTYMPNAFHHETQEEAGLEVHQFYPLVEINCSEDLRLFLCSMYTPICLPNWRYRLTACRSLCESARDGCMPVMQTYGFGWPERMNCDLLPEGSECVSRRNSTTPPKSGTSLSGATDGRSSEEIQTRQKDPSQKLLVDRNPASGKSNTSDLIRLFQTRLNGPLDKDLLEFLETNEDFKHGLSQLLQRSSTESGQRMVCLPCRCRAPFVSIHKPPYNEVVTGGVVGCLPACRSPAFSSKSDRTFATFWLGLWAVLCILSTLATVLTFLADPGRFQYPERPIIYLSACYLMVAFGYLIRVGMGHESVACDGPVLRRGSTGPAQCSVVFLLTYVFGMASSVWWIVLTLTWFLAAGLKWGSEAIAKYSQVYHFFAWFFPGAQAIIILILSGIDGDPVGGLCFVGATNLIYLRLFVLAPMCLYLGLGTIFLIAGFIALFKIRSAIKLQTRGHLKTDKLEKLMIRIGIFGVLYTVPATVVVACICYELSNREQWERNHNCPCIELPALDTTWYSGGKLSPSGEQKRLDTNMFPLKSKDPVGSEQPEYAVFMLKYFMSLVVGITSGFWIWSSKTLDSWQSCVKRAANRSCPTRKKPVQMTSGPVPGPNGTALPGRSPPDTCALPWSNGRSKLWSSNQSKSPGLGVQSCTTWQDDFGPNARLLPQPPAAINLNCSHSLGPHHHHHRHHHHHLGMGGMVGGSSGSLTGPSTQQQQQQLSQSQPQSQPQVLSSGPQHHHHHQQQQQQQQQPTNSNSFTNGPNANDGTALSASSGNAHHNGPVPGGTVGVGQLDPGNVLLIPGNSMTHI
ncbi:Frizzled-8 [Fasciola hepatica]|uniref:Frizzled-8 n=1 Tax=Fasciola hepatica TaxID=6192 RepID=A0A4E0RLN0_FASHE|nr:Frizzled-8 [Fasciola hepatica]